MATIRGNKKNNQLDDDGGNDTLLGLAGDDSFRMADGGRDMMNGGAGRDGFGYFLSKTGVSINLQTGKAVDRKGNVDTFKNMEGAAGSQFADSLTASTRGEEWLMGREGNDKLTGGKGSSWYWLNGGSGNDRIEGKSG